MTRKNDKKKALRVLDEKALKSVSGGLNPELAKSQAQFYSGVFYTLGTQSNDPAVKAFFSGAIKGLNKPA